MPLAGFNKKTRNTSNPLTCEAKPLLGSIVFKSCCFLICLSVLCQPQVASGYEARKPYIPPEILHHRYTQTRFQQSLKVNLNRADLNELRTLPGMDESTALKLIRMRKEGPYQGYQDLSRLPYMDPKRLQRLIQRIQPLSEF
jgi:hypothetical protein